MSLERYTRKSDGLVSLSYKFRYRGRTYRGALGPVSLKTAKLREMQAKILAAEGKHPLPVRQQRQARSAPLPVPTFDAYAPEFLAWYAVDARPRSVKTYTQRLNTHILPFFGPLHLTEATTARIDAYRTARRQEGAMPNTLNGELTVLSLMLRIAMEWGRLPRGNQGVIRWLQADEKPIRVLSYEEEARLLMAAMPRLKPLITFALYTGLRRDELIHLTWQDVDLKRREVQVVATRAKNRRRRTVPLNHAALEALDDAQRRDGRVFGYHSTNASFDIAVKRARLPGVSCHVLRHTFATRALEAGVHIDTLRRWLGHSSIVQTQRYLHRSESYEHQAIELLGNRSHGKPYSMR